MAKFKVILIKHEYPTTEPERGVVAAAGGEFFDGDRLSDQEEQAVCAEADGILVRWGKISAERIKTFRRCKIIVRYGVGTDNVDGDAATEGGIMVGHLPTYCLDDVSTHAIALWLACVRRLTGTHQKLARGGWDPNPPEPIYRTSGRTFGLVGFGNIAQAVARKLQGWGMKLLAADPFVDPARAQGLGVKLVDLEAVFADETGRHFGEYRARPGRGHSGAARGLGRRQTCFSRSRRFRGGTAPVGFAAPNPFAGGPDRSCRVVFGRIAD
jgi:D-3-phosphoglycerate dehydrogenase